ncbi:N-(5'-phosphoribosyl)anthranilate isomerase [Acidiferrobacter sp. SPIII_3]|uniref:N-(5'-phosphoribosyl)anthranilate isomerase n=1 Tax=Acidiferrobacter sp. SPIII_3 TaxID=1281578 RepID=UPI000D7364B8|nr:N-(5'-phosphoribosyl)anthranilate isomerase [Acidiferrobacter sp. SPIII_3]AWP23262.1 N-(5'-phosphoribosyl)anthranilate isomerase [Acidiferrobacter sp. SPIII_3]
MLAKHDSRSAMSGLWKSLLVSQTERILEMSEWINNIFRAGAVNKGGVVRRQKADVLKNGGYKALLKEVKKRHFHLLRTGGQYIIICNKGDL